MMGEIPVEAKPASWDNLLDIPTVAEIDADVFDSECENVPFESFLDLCQWGRVGLDGVDNLCDQASSHTPTLPDMNNPEILEIYSSLVILANHMSAKTLEFTECDPTKQSALQAFAKKLDLRYSYENTTRVVQIEKCPHDSRLNERESTLNYLATVEESYELSIDEIKSLADIGTCWRCETLKEECDTQQPCEACQRLEGPPIRQAWHDVGCRRGGFELQAQAISLCLKDVSLFLGKEPRFINVEVDSCLEDSSRRLKEVLTDLKVSPEKVALETLCQKNLATAAGKLDYYFANNFENNLVTLAWEFIDNPLVKKTMSIESIENTFEVIRTAHAYETEDGSATVISLAIRCLRLCVDILRLRNNAFFRVDLHLDCDDNICHIRCIRELGSCLKRFWDEFLNVVLHKDNAQDDKRWWLHSFYSLWLQAFVCRTIWTLRMEFGLRFENTWNHYQLAVQLFTAASGGQSSYDPLMASWSLDSLQGKPSTELSQMRFYYQAQKAFDTRQWKTSGMKSAYYYLARMIPSRALAEGRTPAGWSVDRDRNQEKPAISSQQYTKPIFIKPRDNSFRPSRRQRVFIFEDDSDDEDCFVQASLPRKNMDLPLSASGRLRNRSRAKRKANSPSANVIGSSSEAGSIMTRSPLSIGMSPTRASYSVDTSIAESPLRINSPPSILSMHSFPRSPLIPERSSYSSGMGSMTMSGTHLPYVSSHESLSTGLHSASTASSASRAVNLRSVDMYMCSCCPKKPKKFETQEELRSHEAEKAYECSFCGNRFKSKNEAERHQNSLHVRRHSWTCSALLVSGYDHAFHESTNSPGQADVCGYCGDEFVRSGRVGHARHPTEQDWDERLHHLQEAHKYRECNSIKKFYRADHFRQHLKHSHAGTSGRWSIMLENACMLEDEPPQPPRR